LITLREAPLLPHKCAYFSTKARPNPCVNP